ncbi:hypothetical protein P43SY_003132 [Pythium insidiosum]|uniref:HVA22-like protein n=1 Tax=Pythium insidiosum TaxID=114742 RepID=A0AAD5LPB3_PYTIN|nr:hypothetical protein P43SY_003132 [Pythium insidiosum]
MGSSSLLRPVHLAIGVAYPAYASFKALETAAPDGSRQWLTYWVVVGIGATAEAASRRLVAWIPGYDLLKTLFLLWLMLPKTRGALLVYRGVLRPLLRQYEPWIDRQLKQRSRGASTRSSLRR